MNSSDANGLRARKRCHSVQHADSDRRVGRLRTDAARHRRLPVSKSNTAGRVQPVNATPMLAFSLSAGVMKPNVFLGR